MFNDSSPVKFHRNFLSEKKIQNLHQASAFFFHRRLHVPTNILSKKCYQLHHFMHTDFTTLHITIRILQTMYQALPDFTVILPTNHKRRCLHCKKYYAGVEFGMKSCNTHISHPILYRHPFSKFAYFSYLPQQPCSLPVSQFESFILLQNIAWR